MDTGNVKKSLSKNKQKTCSLLNNYMRNTAKLPHQNFKVTAKYI